MLYIRDIVIVSPPIEVEDHIEVEICYKDGTKYPINFGHITEAVKFSSTLYQLVMLRRKYSDLIELLISHLKSMDFQYLTSQGRKEPSDEDKEHKYYLESNIEKVAKQLDSYFL